MDITNEQLREGRRLVESGESISETARRLSVRRTTLEYHAIKEGWYGARRRGRERRMNSGERMHTGGISAEQVARLEERVQREERLMEREKMLKEAEAVVERGEGLEILSRRALIRDSERAKLGLSRLINRTIEQLEETEVRPRERALAIQALRNAASGIYRWDEEPSISEMKEAEGPKSPLHRAINLKLINMSPKELRELRGPSEEVEGSDQGGGAEAG
jgi:hypothetical protein